MGRKQLLVRLVLVAVVFGATAFSLRDENPNRVFPREVMCAGVGISTDTYGSTPREALVAFVRSRGGNEKYWELKGTSTFHFTDSRAKPAGLARIEASEESPGVWRVNGACVGNSPVPQTALEPKPIARTTCVPAALKAEVVSGRSHPPFATWNVSITNLADTACVVQGFPTVTMVQNGYRMSFSFLRKSGALIAAPSAAGVELSPGAAAFLVLEKDACLATESIIVNQAEITFPGSAPLVAGVPGRFGLCGVSYEADPVLQSGIVRNLEEAYRPTPATPRCRTRDLTPEDAGATSSGHDSISWAVRFVNTGVAACEIRGTPSLDFNGPQGSVIGLSYAYRGSTTPLMLARGSAVFLRLTKRDCAKSEFKLKNANLYPPASRAAFPIPSPDGLEKCDFHEADANVIRYGPFVTSL